MKKERIAGIALAVVNAVLLVTGFFLYMKLDRTEPGFEFQAMDMIYEEGMDTLRLLDGITAYDNEDGDITDKIVVEKLIENREQDSVVVIYAVNDSAGNVAKCSREFPAIFHPSEEEKEGDGTEVQENWLMQSGFWAELDGKEAGEKEAPVNGMAEDADRGEDNEDSRRGTGDENESLEMPEEENSRDGEEEGMTRDEAGGNDQEEDSEDSGKIPGNVESDHDGAYEEENGQEEEKDSESAREQREGSRGMPDPGAPVLTLKVSEVKTSVGMGPAWVNVIGTLSDDKDSYETLFHNLEVSKYDKNQAGTYLVSVSTKDSDGNRSEAVPLTIIVK